MKKVLKHTDEASDTIAAIATPPGRGGVGIIRISGPSVTSLTEKLLRKKLKPRYAEYGPWYNQFDQVIDIGITLYFNAPHSFTGEDVLEIQAHGGPVILDQLLECLTDLGVRLARPGEFSERAFLNDKLDLVQAEAIADLIDASSKSAATSAMRTLQGEFSREIHKLKDELISLRSYIEAAIDFPDEEVDFLSDGVIESRLIALKESLSGLLENSEQGLLLREGIVLVLCGKPNSGKSTLLNVLSGQERAIVTSVAGTTRDVMKEHILLDGLPVHIVDTAGLRSTDDIIEQEGIRRAWKEIDSADIVLHIHSLDDEDSSELSAELQSKISGKPFLEVVNKIDLSNRTPELSGHKVYISAKEKLGIDILKNRIKEIVGFKDAREGHFTARRRHLHALERANTALENAYSQLKLYQAGELVAEECRIAQEALSEITGEFTTEDLLGEIFSSFCIGK